MNELDKAFEKCTDMIDNMPERYVGNTWLLHGLLNEALGDKEEANKDFDSARSCDSNAITYLDDNQPITLEIFPSMNRLCTLFPVVELSFGSHPKLVVVNCNR